MSVGIESRSNQYILGGVAPFGVALRVRELVEVVAGVKNDPYNGLNEELLGLQNPTQVEDPSEWGAHIE